MKRLFYFLLSIGIILILVATLCKEFHIHGRKWIETTGLVVLLVAMLIYLFTMLRNKKTSF